MANDPTKGAEKGVSCTTIGYDDVIPLYFSLEAEYRRNGAWLINDKTTLHLRTLKDSVGNPRWNHADSTILGMPVYTLSHMPERREAYLVW
ncbi:MAG: phage major capsid protein [Defluviitaleaceae bacterium]|nr:phage major capsid protein [Defluviitaleaceae bacterium]